MKTAIVIVAGGKGTRMGTDVPKQFLSLCDKPVLMHTIELFYKVLKDVQIVLVLPIIHQEYWAMLCKDYNFTIKHSITTGGASRFASVKNGLKKLTNDVLYIGVHDAVRPLVAEEVILNTYALAKKYPAVIPCVDVDDSLRIVNADGNKHVDRSVYKRVQTPQVFQASILLKGYQQNESDRFTDDASVVEASGGEVTLVDGNHENIKITT